MKIHLVYIFAVCVKKLKLILKSLELRLTKKEMSTTRNLITFRMLLQISLLHKKYLPSEERVEKPFLADISKQRTEKTFRFSLVQTLNSTVTA